MDRRTDTFTQMGGEGVPWIGQAAFTETRHVFANLGDGTYFHSGILAIRASVTAKVNITYKILYNDAVAMTGGQHLDGVLTVPQLTRQLAAEAVEKIVIVSDQPEQHRRRKATDPVAEGVEIFHRREMDVVQRKLRETPGTTVLVYEQTCASEKRRRRKRTNPISQAPLYPDPAKRVVINPRVCEGCGDCSKHSNCLSIEPLATVWGTKRTINQSTCNKDYSCLEGICPSLVTVEGAHPIKPTTSAIHATLAKACEAVVEPSFHVHPDALTGRYAVLINGVGGTGVVTIGAWLGMAAHLQGMEALALDMAGLAQKGGAVFSHFQFSPSGYELTSSRIPVGEADLMIGGDLIVSAHEKTLEVLSDNAFVVLNTDTPPTADFIGNAKWCTPGQQLHNDINQSLSSGANRFHIIEAQQAALQLLGDTVFANALLLGMAWQLGCLPMHLSALRKAIELNGVKVKENLLAFDLGRLAAHDRTSFNALLERPGTDLPVETPAQKLKRLCDELQVYQNKAYAERFNQRVLSLRVLFDVHGQSRLWLQLCEVYFKLLAFKDEYEVARLHTDSTWVESVLKQYGPGARLRFHFAPAWLAGQQERPKKISFGPWVVPFLRALASLRRIRGTALDPLRFSVERKNQTLLLTWFESWLELMHNKPEMLQHSNDIERMLGLFDQVKGYGAVRSKAFEQVRFEIQTIVDDTPKLDQYDQNRHQTKQTQGKQTL